MLNQIFERILEPYRPIPQSLTERATDELKKCGHTLRGFDRISPCTATAECVDCGVSVRVNARDNTIDWCECTCQGLLEAKKHRK